MPDCELHVPGLTWKIRLVGFAVGCIGLPCLSLGEHRSDSRWPQGVLLMMAAQRAAAVADDCPASPPGYGHELIELGGRHSDWLLPRKGRLGWLSTCRTREGPNGQSGRPTY